MVNTFIFGFVWQHTKWNISTTFYLVLKSGWKVKLVQLFMTFYGTVIILIKDKLFQFRHFVFPYWPFSYEMWYLYWYFNCCICIANNFLQSHYKSECRLFRYILKSVVLYLTTCMIFVTLLYFMYWQVPYLTGHNPYGSNKRKINWNCAFLVYSPSIQQQMVA